MTSKDNSIFHPLEISFCGHSNSGKTTLIEKLIQLFSNQFDVGYIKHDAHRFEMDHPGKDTYRAQQAGAKTVTISSQEKSAFVLKNLRDQLLIKQNFVDMDVVFIEGYKESLGSKIFVWTGSNEDQVLLDKYCADPNHNLMAIVGTEVSSPQPQFPYFHRDDIKGISSFITKYWIEKIAARPLHSLILAGGRSRRMGRDKGELEYHGKSQVAYLYELLSGITQRTYLSCRSDQKNLNHLKVFPQINDRYIDFGPTGGILSAFHLHPQSAWLVVACDMPYINKDSILELIEKRNPYAIATAFYNGEKKWPEPLCAIYEPKAAQKLGTYLAMGKPCPRKILINSKIELLEPSDGKLLDNANTPEDFEQMKQYMSGVAYEN